MEPNSLDELYQIYVQDIYAYLRSLCHDHYLAEDLMQETFYRAYRIWRIAGRTRLSPGCSVLRTMRLWIIRGRREEHHSRVYLLLPPANRTII
ncbi:sigma factor [Paenibacillus sonchi]|uniref:sigma factor n=1 Tax=Paenibacillus sonchi TaxID=373687 RepID=UPI000688B331|nr:hypothetical protein [Paenibacillus sonchi]